MGESWANNRTKRYVQSGNVMDATYDSYRINNFGDFRSRAYVNPCLVNCPVAYTNASNVAVPKKIHINPNFKGHRPFLQSENAHEPSSVHINPYFGRSKIDSSRNEQLQQTSFYQCNKFYGIASQTDIKSIESNDEKVVNKCSKPEKTALENCNSELSSQTAATSKCSTSKLLSSQSKSQSNKINLSVDFFGKSLDIKTRHKIVHVNNFKLETHGNRNLNRKLLNRYKLINVKKSEKDSDKNLRNCVPGRKRSMIINLESNNVKEKKEKIIAQNLNLLKLKYCLKRNSPVYKITNSIKTKYIHQNKTLWQRKRPVNLLRNSNHRLDKRMIPSELNKANQTLHTYNHQKKTSKNVPQHKAKTTLSLWKSPLTKLKYYNHFMWRKEGKSENDVLRIKNSYPNRTVVKINGIMYKSSSNKLTRAKIKKRDIRTENDEQFLSSKKKHQIVYVRGEKFLLDSSGKTIVRQPKLVNTPDGRKSFVRRIDLGGVTYIQKSKNVLIRTNTHQARQLVHSAKQKSIALLQHLHKRNNMPCMIYQRFGICRRHNKGMCIYVHDPKNIDLCKKFLKGECHSSNCPLSHNAVKEKMATCHFFLKGKCNKEDCHYLHVKVNKKAVICRDFLRGFCDLGQDCTKRHVHRCPEFDEKGICSRGVNCPYPHKTSVGKKSQMKFKMSKRISSSGSDERKGNSRESVDCKTVKKNGSRTKFESSKKRKMKMEGKRLELNEKDGMGNDSIVECIPKRVKLTDLPLFIPLNIE